MKTNIKTRLASAIMLLLLLLTVTACVKQPSQDTSLPPDTSKATEDDTSNAAAEKVLYGTKLGDNMLDASYIDKNGPATDAKLYGQDKLIVAYTDYDRDVTGCSVYDIYTGESVDLYEFDESFIAKLTLYENGSFSMSSTSGYYCHFKNIDDREPLVLELPDFENDAMVSYYFLEQGAYFKESDLGISYTDGDESTEIYTNSGEYETPMVLYYLGTTVFFTVYDSVNGSELLMGYDFSSGKTELYGTAASYLTRCYNEILYTKNYNSPELEIKSGALPYISTRILLESPDEYLYYGTGEYIVTAEEIAEETNYEKLSTVVRLYSENGSMYFCESFEYNDYSVSEGHISEETGLFLLVLYDYAETQYDMVEKSKVIICIPGTEKLERTASTLIVEKDAGVYAYELGEKWNITIKAADDAMINFPDFTAIPEYDLYIIRDALESIESVFELFPEGFFDELFSDLEGVEYWQNNLTICLTGKLIPLNEYSTSMPIAYAYSSGNTQYIVLDIKNASGTFLRQNLAHELMHAIEERIDALTVAGFDGFEDWFSYAPRNSYNYSYVDNDGNDFNDYTYTVFDTENTVYFIDSYSRTFPTEDRARLFENLFMAGSEPSSVINDYPNIRERAEYLCSVIRAAFTTVSSQDEVWWERHLNISK